MGFNILNSVSSILSAYASVNTNKVKTQTNNSQKALLTAIHNAKSFRELKKTIYTEKTLKLKKGINQ